jgi:glycosyltransferase involved in cell wall biosynthesis
MAVGCPVITSRSSSLIELGLEPPFYFDPLSTWDFYRAFKAVNELTLEERRLQSRDLIEKASDFTWQRFSAAIIDRIKNRVYGEVPRPEDKRRALSIESPGQKGQTRTRKRRSVL